MIIKTSELVRDALDWIVAHIEFNGEYRPVALPKYSSDWSQGGPIIEREKITLVSGTFTYFDTSEPYVAHIYQGKDIFAYGDTPLIAAMRCYVASKLGDTVDVPEELL